MKLPKLGLRKALPWILVFHPRGPFGRIGPWIALTLAIAALPFVLVPEARNRIVEAFSERLAVPTPQVSAPTTPNATDGQAPTGTPTSFDPLRQTGAWTLRDADLDRTRWSWERTKTFAADVWEAQLPGTGTFSSFYCGCTIARTGASSGEVELAACNYQDAGNLNRARRLEWEHIVPASRIGEGRACWTTGLPACANAQGVVEKGRSCCERADPLYQLMANDPVNLAPSIGEVNGARSNHPFGLVAPGEGVGFGPQCGMRIDSQAGIAEPPPHRRGDIARVYAYMNRAYGLAVPRADAELYSAWMAADPVSEEEIAINRAIAAQGHRPNPFVLPSPTPTP